MKVITALFLWLFSGHIRHTTSNKQFECTIGSSRTRHFDSLRSYQGNKLKFELTGAGNSVAFTFKALDHVPKNAFIAYDSDHVVRLSLSGKSMRRISDGAFLSLFCLHFLELRGNEIEDVNGATFESLVNLVELDLSGNCLEEIRDGTFAKLRRLKKLQLSRNRIKALMPNAFFNLSALEELHLSSNRIRTLSGDNMRPLVNLVNLQLDSNNLSEGNPESWVALKSMTILNVANNTLSSFDSAYNFSFCNLRTLNLSSNSLTTLNVLGLKQNLPQLDYININDNPWPCYGLEIIVHQLRQYRIYYKGNNESDASLMGIACVPPSTTPRTTPEASRSPPPPPSSSSASEDGDEAIAPAVRDGAKANLETSTQNKMTAAFVGVILIVVLMVVVLKSGIISKLLVRRRRGRYYTCVDAEDVPLCSRM